MFSTLTGIFYHKSAPKSELVQRVAKGADFLAMITLIVLGALAMNGIGGLVLPACGSYFMIGAGILGLTLLAARNMQKTKKLNFES